MRALVVACALGCAAPASAQEIAIPPGVTLAPGASPATLLPAVIELSRSTARIEEGRLVGAGADFLRELGANSDFMLMGEDHGNAGIAEFATAYWRDLSAAGYQYGAVEADPYVTAALERELRAGGLGGWDRFLAAQGGAGAAPFFDWAPETEWALAMVQSSRPARGQPTLWALDQVFIGAAPWLLRDMAQNARSADARALAGELAARSARPPGAEDGGFAGIDAAALQRLRGMLTHRADARFAQLADDLILSHRIYQPFTTGAGNAYIANDERETLMMRLFQARYEAAVRAGDRRPRVMFKFGANHMYRGATPTQVQGLGGFVTEYARARGLRASSVAVVCGPGGSVVRLGAEPLACDAYFADAFAFLADYVSSTELTVFDLRVWRTRHTRWAHLPAQAQRLIGSFDALVVVPNGAPAAYLPSLAPQ